MMKKCMILLFVGLMVCVIPGIASSDQGVTKDSVTIGVMTDLTGVSAVWGGPLRQAGDIWAAEVNSKGGIHGRKIKMVYGDHAYRTDKALSEAKRLVKYEKVFCFAAGLNTNTNLVASAYAIKNKIPWVFPINSLPKYHKKLNPYVFNFSPLHEPLSRVCVDYAIKTYNPKKFGVFYQFDEYGQTELANIKDQLSKYGKKVAWEEHFKKGQLSVSAEVARMKGAGVDAVIILGYTGVTASFLKDAKRTGWDAHFLGSTSSSNHHMIKLSAGAAEGMICPVWMTLPRDESLDTKELARIRSIWKKYYPDVKLGYANMLYIAYEGLGRALELAGPNLTNETFLKAIETGFTDYSTGVMGPVTYTSKSHSGTNTCKLYVVENGKFETIPGWDGFLTPKK